MPLGTLVYDDQEAAAFIAARAGHDVETVSRFLEARTQYQKMTGRFGSSEREALEEERSLHSDLLPDDDEYLSLVAAYVRRVTDLPAEWILDKIAKETAYMLETGIMDADAYTDVRAWADEYKQGNVPVG